MNRGGRPRKYADKEEGNRARVQQYRERQRHPLPTAPPSQFQNILLAWDPRPQITAVLPTDNPSNIFADLQEALEAVPPNQEDIGLQGAPGEEDDSEDDQGLEMEDGIMVSPARPDDEDSRWSSINLFS